MICYNASRRCWKLWTQTRNCPCPRSCTPDMHAQWSCAHQPLSSWPPAHLGVAAPQNSQHAQDQAAQMAALSQGLPRQPLHSMDPHQEAQEHAAAQRPDAQQTLPPASCAHALFPPRSSCEPAAAQRGMLQPSLGTEAQEGRVRLGASPEKQLAQPAQPAQMGVLQSGSSEELARALADLTQMVSCARSDPNQGAYPGAARPAQVSQLDTCLVPIRTEQQLPCQHQAPPEQTLLPPSQVRAGQYGSQHRGVPESMKDINSTIHPSLSFGEAQRPFTNGSDEPHPSSPAEQHMLLPDKQLSPVLGLQRSSGVQLEAPDTQRQGPQQPATPVTAQQHHSGEEHERKRKRDSSQPCRLYQPLTHPTELERDCKAPLKRVKLSNTPSQMDHTASQMPPLQTQAGPYVAHDSPADISLGVESPPVAQARSLHATLRCAPPTSASCDCPNQERQCDVQACLLRLTLFEMRCHTACMQGRCRTQHIHG